MEAEIVEQQGTNHIFPKTIPEKRNNRDFKAKIIFGLSLIAVGTLLSTDKPKFFVLSSSSSFLFFVCTEILLRICNLFEEYSHLASRYEDDVIKMIKECFECKYNIVAIVIAIFCICFMGNPLNVIPESLQTDGVLPWVLVLLGTNFFVKIMKLEQCTLNIAKQMDELQGMDYGSGMAYSFFYGYLNIIIPCTGDERHGLKEQIEDYASTHQVKFKTNKLYILIPISAHCPTSLKERSNYIIGSSNLSWRTLDRAGVKERQYHNTVYKLEPEKNQEPVYVCAEYATPLLTLYEVMNHDTDDSRRYKKYKKEIVTNFYLTLHKIIETSRDCRDLIELIYFRDVDKDGTPLSLKELDVGLLLLERINQEDN